MASSISAMRSGGTWPMVAPIRVTDRARICSTWAADGTRSPVLRIGRTTWTSRPRSMRLVSGTTVTSPRPRRSTVLLASSPLTITAGRRLAASYSRAGSRSAQTMSPRHIGLVFDTIADCHVPNVVFFIPIGPELFVLPLEILGAKASQRLANDRRARRLTVLGHLSINELNVLVWEADTQLHTSNTTSGSKSCPYPICPQHPAPPGSASYARPPNRAQRATMDACGG